ncbi:signal recognition particle 54 kDa protein 2-like isoform X3 [Olea europaea var. sylvestris]|uniref:signal recognition particle 54 kDa protein 2-like isoform X3 n=1 Tax=Olea europaea var. sylvestris TaxID=158386 RepID=UPI000C1D1241|nr:signal recognition particle 54 kDa protein 2-like isoform X3 [Olea europaea var. sylvestris]
MRTRLDKSCSNKKSSDIYLKSEHMNEFEVFDAKPFVSRLLGMCDLSGFMDKVHEVIPKDQQTKFLEKLEEGKFTLRIMFEYVQHILQMGPIGQRTRKGRSRRNSPKNGGAWIHAVR